VTGSDTNYLSIFVDCGSDYIYGGYVVIEEAT
jgi:hypothetical protein